jgi:hypothetical protein
MRGAHLPYALAATAALSIGLSFSFWRSAVENDRLQRANLTAGVALEAAQDEAKLLREKFEREVKERHMAEAAQTIAESAERTAREKLAQEAKTRQAMEAALAKTEAAIHETSQKLAQEEGMRRAAESEWQAAASRVEEEQNSKLAAQEARLAAETALANAQAKLQQEEQARQVAENAVALVTAKMTEQLLAMKSAEASLLDAAARVRIFRNDRLGAKSPREAKLSDATPKKDSVGAFGPGSQIEAPFQAAALHLTESAQAAVPAKETATVSTPDESGVGGEARPPAIPIQYCASSARAFEERPDLFVPFCFGLAARPQSGAEATAGAQGGLVRPAGSGRHGLRQKPVVLVQSRRTASRMRILPVELHIPRSRRSHLVRHPRTRRAERSAFLRPKQPA